jgi:RNA 3'-terminal phosphate cyclase
MVPDAHVPTNISIIEKFIPIRFNLTQGGRGFSIVAIQR